MTPQEKAVELVNKFRNEFNWVEKDYAVDLYRDTRQCALIAVEEILLDKECSFSKTAIEEKQYWIDVKEEIEKL